MTPPPVSADELHQPIFLDQAHGVTPVTTAHVADDVAICTNGVPNARLVVSPDGTQLRTFYLGTAPNTTNEWQNNLTDADRSRLLDINDALWQQIFGARGDFLFYRPLTSGSNTVLFQPLCRDRDPISGSPGPNARYRLYYADMPTLQHPPDSPAYRQVVNFVFQPGEIDNLVRGLPRMDGNGTLIDPIAQYGIPPNDPHTLLLMPTNYTTDAQRQRLYAAIRDPQSPITASRREPLIQALEQTFLPERNQEQAQAAARRAAEGSDGLWWKISLAQLPIMLPTLYFGARQMGMTKPIDPIVDRVIGGVWRLFGLRARIDFMRTITPEIAKTLPLGVGRDADYIRLRERLSMNRGRVTTIIAQAGEGKTHFAMGFFREIYEGRVPEFNAATTDGHTLDLSGLIGSEDAKYVGQIQSRWNDFVKRVEEGARAGRTQVVFVDEIHRLAGMGATEGGGANDLGNTAKAKLSEWETNPNIRLIAATTAAEYPLLIRNPQTGEADAAMRRRYPALRLTRLPRNLLADIVNDAATKWEARGVRIPQAARDRALDLGYHPDVEIANPDAALTILDLAETRARIRGLTEVTPDLVNEVFAEDVSIKQHSAPVTEIAGWSFDQAEYDRRMAAADAALRGVTGEPTPPPPPVTPPPPPPPTGGGASTSPLNRFRADQLRDGDFINGLNQADPTGRLARAYRIISPEGRPLRNIGQFLDAVAVHYPDLMTTVTADLTRRGLDCNASPWRVLFEATARIASAEGAADGRIPRARVADVQARMTQSADFDRNMGGGRPADADPTRVDPARDRDRDRDARDPVRLGRP